MPESFTSIDETASYAFTYLVTWASGGVLSTPSSDLGGGQYGFDELGSVPGLPRISHESVRFSILADDAGGMNDAVDVMINRLWAIGRGKLWVSDNAGNRRWCYARIDAIPQPERSTQYVNLIPVIATFKRFSHWFDEDPMEFEGNGTRDNPVDFIVNNPGGANSYPILQIDPTGGTNQILSWRWDNLETGEWVSAEDSQPFSAAFNYRFDAENMSAYLFQSSGHDPSPGTTRYSLWDRTQYPVTQAPFMTVLPGQQTIRFEVTGATVGSSSADYYFRFYPAYIM